MATSGCWSLSEALRVGVHGLGQLFASSFARALARSLALCSLANQSEAIHFCAPAQTFALYDARPKPAQSAQIKRVESSRVGALAS